MRYEITEDKEVYIYSEGEEAIIYQPYYPDRKPFESETAAAAWAEQWIYEAENYVPEEEADLEEPTV